MSNSPVSAGAIDAAVRGVVLHDEDNRDLDARVAEGLELREERGHSGELVAATR